MTPLQRGVRPSSEVCRRDHVCGLRKFVGIFGHEPRLGDRAMKPDVWEIVKKPDGTFDMFRKGKLLHSSIPEKWLADQVGHYGFCGQEYDDIRRQLEENGKAKIVL
jgi:hypothetical protein